MANTIIRPTIPEPPDLSIMETGEAQTNSQVYSLSFPSVVTDPMQVRLPSGLYFKWQPTELCYKDENGQFDYIVGSSPSQLTVRRKQATYERTFPEADDIFHAEGKQVKHWTILHEQPRDPADYLTGRTYFGISGIVEGLTVEPGVYARIEFENITLPKPVVKDLLGNTIEGFYEVIESELEIVHEHTDPDTGEIYTTTEYKPITQLFIWFDAEFLDAAVYPIQIDPTVVVSGYFATDGNNSRKIIRLNNGNLVACTYDTNETKVNLYKSTDNGTTWEFATSINWETINDYAIVSNDIDEIFVFVVNYNGGIYRAVIYKFSSDLSTLLSSEYIEDDLSLGYQKCSMVIDSNGHIHLAWATIDKSYGNSYNIKYSKSTDGGSTWDTPILITKWNQSGQNWFNPCIVISNDGKPVIIARWYNGTTFYIIALKEGLSTYDLGSSSTIATGWGNSAIYTVSSYSQDYPCAVVDGNGIIHAVWHGEDASSPNYYNIFYSKSIDNGETWESPINLTNKNSSHDAQPSIAVDDNNSLHLFWQGIDAGSSNIWYQILYKKYDGTWGEEQAITTNTTGNALYPNAMEKEKGSMIGFIWDDEETGAIKFDKIVFNQAPNAPVLTTKANFDATEDGIFEWTYSDPDISDSQSAYQLQITRVSDGTIVLDTGKVANTSESYTLSANTLSNGLQYQWRVKTWDSSDTEGPYSDYSTFYTSAKPTVSITYPVSAISASQLTVEWSTSDPESEGQGAYRVRLLDANDAELWDSGKVVDTSARSRTIDYTLENGSTYKVEITVWDAKDVQGIPDTNTFEVSYLTPEYPSFTVTTGANYISLNITNPEPTGFKPTTAYNDIYRRKAGESTWTRIKTNQDVNSVFTDYAVASGVIYEYKVRAISSIGTYADSHTLAGSGTSTASIFSLPADLPKGQISAVVKGQTISQFVKNGNFADGSTGWYMTASTLSVSNNTLSITGDGTNQVVRAGQLTSIKPEINSKIFVRAILTVKNSDANDIYLRLRDGVSGSVVLELRQNAPTINTRYILYGICTISSELSNNLAVLLDTIYLDSTTANGKTTEAQEVMAIDLTSHGLDSLTADECNERFPHWLQYGVNSTNSVTVVIQDPEGNETGRWAPDPSLFPLRSLPNGTNDEISTDGTRIQRIGHVDNVASGTVINYADMATGGQFYAWNSLGETQTGVKGDTLSINADGLNYQLAEEIHTQISPANLQGGGGYTFILESTDWAQSTVPETEWELYESQTHTASITLHDAWLHVVSDPTKQVNLKYKPIRSFRSTVERKVAVFAGRTNPVSEFGEHEYLDLGLSFLIFNVADLEMLQEICKSKQTLLYRDNRGRKEYITVEGLDIKDEQPNHWSVSLINPTKVSYQEAV